MGEIPFDQLVRLPKFPVQTASGWEGFFLLKSKASVAFARRIGRVFFVAPFWYVLKMVHRLTLWKRVGKLLVKSKT